MNIEHQIRSLQGADFPSDPTPKVSYIIPWTIGAAFLVAMGVAAWVVFG